MEFPGIQMRRITKPIFGLVVVLGLVLSACQAAAPVEETQPAAGGTVEIPVTGSTAAPLATQAATQAGSILEETPDDYAEMNETPAGGDAVNGVARVEVSEDPTLGPFLVDDEGMTLYIFTKDPPNQSACEDNCLENWPPLISDGEVQAGDGVTATLDVIERSDGRMQVTANGMPLYYYKPDTKPGDVSGQGVGEVWYVVSPDGSVVQ